ncbi:MAG TPA: hypothetical protein VKS19_05535 [Verrucomicrobiae bacterium]|nr:hypothetical protein [Verrucomicrobiae bacterium]
MGIVDFILNLAGLLLWLNWRSLRFDPLGKRTPATLIGTLRRAEPQRMRRWHLPVTLGGLLFLRAVLYWQIGSGVGWAAGKLNLGVIELSFRSDLFGHILLFSILSFGLTLCVFYLWLLLFSILAGPEPFHRLVRMQLGLMDRLPRWIKFFLPLALVSLLWWLASWLLAWLAIVPQPVSAMHRVEASLVIGLGSYLAWKFAAGLLLVLHLLNNYVYFGKHSFWNYVSAEAQTLLKPLRTVLRWLGRALILFLPRTSRLRQGKVNFSPALDNALTSLLNVLGIVLVFLFAELAERGLATLYLRLPL